jgi:4-diphosphocytidyl-2C-methyl-D-erythritol kinase
MKGSKTELLSMHCFAKVNKVLSVLQSHEFVFPHDLTSRLGFATVIHVLCIVTYTFDAKHVYCSEDNSIHRTWQPMKR